MNAIPKMLALAPAALLIACATPRAAAPADDERAIHAQLDEMVRAWNASDLDGHVAVYADDATWMTAKGEISGRAVIRKRIADRFQRGGALVGRVSFSDIVIHVLSPDVAYNTMAFHMTDMPDGQPVDGRSTLIWTRRGTSWRIVHDYSR